ncbi:hypothetical protein JAO76_10960 [Pontibacter sp. BT310]|uniref:Uncharacterized protein n=1 Tax=Pontibacter populi TaxID=890055 RepID=A0ABS6XEE1_9BACT|nr:MULTISPECIES: hypothetical protein [Pontibacter]MBJ6118716.1 hypothetical protein [Pontibacter sp. BT310]MBR0571145.1 hypothetical protein [Microvirga sp. STS03]MBW3365570.1 hypothetical protein [Pontibacter populi]
MKKLLFTCLALFVVLACQAQDILTKRNGDELQVKVQEITLTEVKYKRFDNPDGPLISILKSEVFMIKYENGVKTVIANEASSTSTPSVYQQPQQQHLKLSGPRLGFTVLSSKLVDNLEEEHMESVSPFITQFGWQFETRIFTLDNGTSGLFEFVPLVGGLEQGKFLPSLSALVGIRGPKGIEFGVGPNLSVAGAGLVFAAGTNFQSQGINFPVNVAFAPSKDGARFSVLFGFNSRRD